MNPTSARREPSDIGGTTSIGPFRPSSTKDFRRAVATHLDRQIGSTAAAKQLGHGNDDVTIEYYIERQREIADFAEVIDTLFQFSE